jgi:hypothetical protein
MTVTTDKKELIELVQSTYQNIKNLINTFKTDITTLKNTIDSIDLINSTINNTFSTNYDTIITQFINDLTLVLNTRKDNIKEDGSLVIRPVNSGTEDYTSTIWYTHISNYQDIQRYFTSRIICRYDNFSIVTNTTSSPELILEYIFFIKNSTFSVPSSLSIGLDSYPLTRNDTVKTNLEGVLTTLSNIQDCCTRNITIITYALNDFIRLFINS